MDRFAYWKPLTVVVAVVAASLVAGGYGYAALTAAYNNTYTGCLRYGQILSVKIGTTPRAPCVKPGKAISWNQEGRPGPSAGFTQFVSGDGGAGAIQLPENPQEAVRVLTLNVPPDWVAAPNEPGDEPIYRDGVTGVVATVSVLLFNRSPVMTHPGCTVLSDQGGFGDGHMYLSGMDANGVSPNTTYLTFQATSPAGPPSEIYLTCSVASDHPPLPPNTSIDVRVLSARMSVVPRGF
jgi:hypothetical protein